jgi:hypothetical protein
MKTAKKHYANNLEDAFLKCYYSEKGCNKFPVRMVAFATGETAADGKPILDGVMLCLDHSATYQPDGKVVVDKILANESTVEFLRSHGI